MLSHLARGVWVEIICMKTFQKLGGHISQEVCELKYHCNCVSATRRHTPQEVCELKFLYRPPNALSFRHTSQGVYGLKYYNYSPQQLHWDVTPHKRCVSWNPTRIKITGFDLSHLARGVWVEIRMELHQITVYMSRLTRGVWVEIGLQPQRSG